MSIPCILQSMSHNQTMKTPLSFIYFLSLTLLVSTQTPTSTDPSYYYNLCAPSPCNDLTLSYPFSLPTPCHPSSLQTRCTVNQTFLLNNPTSTDTFRVLSIDYRDPTSISFTIASDSVFTCGSQISSPRYWNTGSLFSLPLYYTFGTHFNCTAPIVSSSIRGLQNATCLGCEGQDPSNLCYYAPSLLPAVPNCEIYFIFSLANSSYNASMTNPRGLLQSGFEIRYAKPVGCTQCEASGGRCGVSPLSGSLVCFCPASVHTTNCTDGMVEDLSEWVKAARTGGRRVSKAAVAVISFSASILLLVAIAILVAILVHRRKRHVHFNMESISSVSPTRYSYSQLKNFTKKFASKLGEGGFGSVYKGTINQGDVAVKMMKKSKKTEKQFINELQTIGSIHHHNLLGVLGYCVERNTCALVYEFMENGSLDKYIYNTVKETDSNDIKKLSCKQVYNIALETARGILYLHQGCRNRILHCDIKPSNILLDSNLSAKVADFGHARMMDKDHSHVSLTGAQGTPGYAAPEIWLKAFGPVTDKSDVYSYGMLVLEMVGRRKNYDPEAADPSQVYFPEWLYNILERDEFHLLLDRGVDGDSSEVVSDEKNRIEEGEVAIRRMCLVGLWCIQHIPSNRPTMDIVIQVLEGHVEIQIPSPPFPLNTQVSSSSIG